MWEDIANGHIATYDLGFCLLTQLNFVLVNAGIVCVNLPAFKLHTFYNV